jgi:DtxR family Mn-dependent transcriptional regulator
MELSAAIEDYVRAIYDLGRDGNPVSTSALAERLGVAPASVTGMLKRLAGLGLVRHQPYAGVELTPAGRKVALEVMRHHRLIETYLAEAMGVAWDQVHDEAHRLEHHISEDLEDRIAELLGHPERDPHGAMIPPKEGPFQEPDYPTLAEADPGARLVVREVSDEDADRLRYLGELGLLPDVELVVTAVAPYGGPITVRVGDEEHAIGPELARTVSVIEASAADN